jgi:hypothetical protein
LVDFGVTIIEATRTPYFSLPAIYTSSMADELLRWIRATLDGIGLI